MQQFTKKDPIHWYESLRTALRREDEEYLKKLMPTKKIANICPNEQRLLLAQHGVQMLSQLDLL